MRPEANCQRRAVTYYRKEFWCSFFGELYKKCFGQGLCTKMIAEYFELKLITIVQQALSVLQLDKMFILVNKDLYMVYVRYVSPITEAL